jgi:hypothetical protein
VILERGGHLGGVHLGSGKSAAPAVSSEVRVGEVYPQTFASNISYFLVLNKTDSHFSLFKWSLEKDCFAFLSLMNSLEKD